MDTVHLEDVLPLRKMQNSFSTCTVNIMAYPAKTDREAIFRTGMELLAEKGLPGLSLRSVAARLGVAPNALYRYFADREALEAAIAAESAHRMHQALKRAAGNLEPEAALHAIARAYLRFARQKPEWYAMMMAPRQCEAPPEPHADLWLFVLGQVARISGEARMAEAAVALWAFLHGVAGLEAAEVFQQPASHMKPRSSVDFGLDAWLRAAAADAESAG